jgi:hypothetical protein
VPILQSSGQVVAFMTQHLDLPIPSPALFDKIGQKFRRAAASFAEANHIPWVRFSKDDRKADVMAPYLRRAAATGRFTPGRLAAEPAASASRAEPGTRSAPPPPPLPKPSPRGERTPSDETTSPR